VNIFEEILWPDFKRLPKVAKLPLNEQVSLYNIYLAELSMERYKNWLHYQPKGHIPTIQNVGLLAQEEYDSTTQNYFLVLQEDGSGIYVTALV
jgi:hypothetical protein